MEPYNVILKLTFLTQHASFDSHLSGCMDLYFAPFYGCVTFLGMDVPLFNYSLILGHFICFEVLAVTHKAAMNHCVQVSV